MISVAHSSATAKFKVASMLMLRALGRRGWQYGSGSCRTRVWNCTAAATTALDQYKAIIGVLPTAAATGTATPATVCMAVRYMSLSPKKRAKRLVERTRRQQLKDQVAYSQCIVVVVLIVPSLSHL